MSDSKDSEDERQEFQDKYRKYLKSLISFRNVQQHFEEEIPLVSTLSRNVRAAFVLGNYEKLLWGFNDRPKHLKMETILDGINEFQTFCDAIRIGWKLWPDWWNGLQMMLDYLSDDTRTEDLESLDLSTLTVLKEIAKCEIWPNNQICGSRIMGPQAKCILIRFERKCSFYGATITTNPLNPFDSLIASFRICDGINCFKVETDTVKFKMCGKCKKMFYCSKDCQKLSWKGGHKKVCHS